MDNTPLLINGGEVNGNSGTHNIDSNIEMERSSSGNNASFNFSDGRKTTVTTDTLGVGETDADKSNANGVNIIFWKRIYLIIKIGHICLMALLKQQLITLIGLNPLVKAIIPISWQLLVKN